MTGSVWTDPEAIKRFLASSELSQVYTGDMASMDSAWHHWMQPIYVKARRWWNAQKS